MNKNQHITDSQFVEILNKRMDEYFIAITGNKGSASGAAFIKTSQRLNIQTAHTHCLKSKLFSGDVWGYGINSISDGNESHSSVDVEDFRKIQDLNKHQHEHRFLWLLTFKIENSSLYVSIFCIDTATFGVNSNLNTKYDLKAFKNARMRMRGSKIYVDIFFIGIEKPISFQVDNYVQGGQLHGEQLAQYYIDSITESARVAIENASVAATGLSSQPNLNDEIDEIEMYLRNTIVEVFELKMGKTDYLDILTGKPKNQIKRRIQQHVDKHPREKIEDYKTLEQAIDFSDIEHLKQIILKDENWVHFDKIFKDKKTTEKYFDQLSTIRHTIKHTRKMSVLVRHEGNAAIEWFKQILNL